MTRWRAKRTRSSRPVSMSLRCRLLRGSLKPPSEESPRREAYTHRGAHILPRQARRRQVAEVLGRVEALELLAAVAEEVQDAGAAQVLVAGLGVDIGLERLVELVVVDHDPDLGHAKEV